MRQVREYYESQSRTFGQSAITDEHRRIAHVIASIAGTSGDSGTALEIGCGNGAVAAVLADQGMTVTAVDFDSAAMAIARSFAEPRGGCLRPVEADFYTANLPGNYDLVYYWDGFGVGEDEDQIRLLARVRGWLAPGGRAVVDVFSTYYWIQKHGTSSVFQATNGDQWERRIEFDFRECRMNDSWVNLDDASISPRSQSLRCYTPADFVALVSQAGLDVVGLYTSNGEEIIGNDGDAIQKRTSFLALLE